MPHAAAAVLKEQFDITSKLATSIMALIQVKRDAGQPVRISTADIAMLSKLAAETVKDYLNNPAMMAQVWFKMGGKSMVSAPLFIKGNLILP